MSGIDGWAYWLWYGWENGVPSDASNEDMYDYIDYIDKGGSLNYQKWYEHKNTPIGDGILFMIIISLLYAYICYKSYQSNENYKDWKSFNRTNGY